MMEMSVNAEVLVSDVASSSLDTAEEEGEAAAPPAACKSSSSSDVFDAMAEFGSRLKDIIGTHGSAAGLLDRQSAIEAEVEEMKKESKADMVVSTETDVSLILQSLKVFSSPQDKLDDLVKKHAQLEISHDDEPDYDTIILTPESVPSIVDNPDVPTLTRTDSIFAACRRCDEQKRLVLQQRLTDLLDETRSSVSARGKLEGLCRELQGHYDLLREETLLRCKEDEEKRSEIASHFQTKLTEIQVQIEQHSVRNDKLCHENINLTDKLESLMGQCELREESLEKINQRRDLQQKLTEAKLQQAEALLTEAVEKHQREKEYLLREAIDKTKKCFAMKEQELSMKKKLTLYAQKFDEFQATLAKSNEIYARFKKEMDNMSDKMKKMEKESNLWKTRFENCNKALANMIEERTEKSKEYELFVMKIQKLEKLCRVLQEERAVLYNKIKDVRISNANIQAKVLEGSNPDDVPVTDGADQSDPLTPTELQEIQEEDPVLTEDMSRLKEEQRKLQEFATSLFAMPVDDEEDHHESDPEEDLVASAFDQFQTKTEVKGEAVPVPETVVEVMPEEPVLPLEPMSPTEGSALTEPTPEDETPGAVKAETQVEEEKVQPVKSDEDLQQKPSEPQPENVKISPPSELKPEAAEAEILAGETEPVEQRKVQALQVPEEAPTKSESAPPSETSPTTIAPSNSNSSRKQTPKKKKKKNSNKNAS